MLVIVAPVTSSRLAALPAAAAAALAAYVSFGAIAFTGPSTGLGTGPSTAIGTGVGARLGVLPLDAPHVALALLAGLVVLAIGLRGRSAGSTLASPPVRSPQAVATAIAVSPLLLLFLPWLPFPVPAAFLIWTGALGTLVWIAVAIALARVAARGWDLTLFRPARPAVLPGVLAAVVFALAAFHASPSLPGGDEPHYLVITQSLLYDGDLKIENNHRRGDYRAYFGGDLPPHVVRPGQNGAMYSIHAPGLPALILPAFAIGGYHGVVVLLILIAAAACALAWWLAWRTTGNMSAAWFGWAAVMVSAPFLLESYTVFPDGPGAAIVLTGFWALLRADRPAAEHLGEAAAEHAEYADGSWVPWLLHGAALAALPWLHTRFVVLAATLGGLILVRLARAPHPFVKATAFLAVPAAGALAWLGFFLAVYGTPDPTAPYGGDVGSSLAFLPNGFGGLLFDQGFGLLATAPVLAVAFIGFARAPRLAVEWLVVAVPYLLAVATFPMWWAGSSGPARFLVPLLLPLAIPAACAWAAACGERTGEAARVEPACGERTGEAARVEPSRGAKAVLLAALIVSAWLSAVMAGGGDGRLGYHTRNMGGMTAAPYLEWANQVVDLPAAFPAFVPLPVQPDPGGLVSRRLAARSGFLATLPWAICLGLAVLAIARIGRRSVSGDVLAAATALTLVCAFMASLSIVWTMRAVGPVPGPPAHIRALRRRSCAGRGLRSLVASPVARGGRPGDANRRAGAAARARKKGAANRPSPCFPFCRPAPMRLSVKRHGAGDGLLMVGSATISSRSSRSRSPRSTPACASTCRRGRAR